MNSKYWKKYHGKSNTLINKKSILLSKKTKTEKHFFEREELETILNLEIVITVFYS